MRKERDGLHFPFAAPKVLCPYPRHYCPYGHSTTGHLYLNLFSWVGTLLAHTTQTTSGTRNHGRPSKSFFFFFFFVNAISWHNDNVFACRFKSREKAYAEIGRKCTSSAFSYTFPTMTFMTDENPKQITPAAYMMRLLIRGAKSLVTLTSPCATSTFQSKETANRAYYAL